MVLLDELENNGKGKCCGWVHSQPIIPTISVTGHSLVSVIWIPVAHMKPLPTHLLRSYGRPNSVKGKGHLHIVHITHALNKSQHGIIVYIGRVLVRTYAIQLRHYIALYLLSSYIEQLVKLC